MTTTIATDDNETAKTIEQELLHSLQESLPQSQNTSIILSARLAGGELVGGVTGSTSYGWLLIKTLWVKPSRRQKGLGKSLVLAIENKALSTGCHAAWLDTSNPMARVFYEKLGYEGFAELANTELQKPSEHRRWFLKKLLTANQR
ncbi:MAG: GNAT family N-acetyltransferase [Gammaproteobacteria bacterium]|nr:GNAT family N-acetyltransferase [Gammaproteobacteria bacterium]